jgi:hypothetical protein
MLGKTIADPVDLPVRGFRGQAAIRLKLLRAASVSCS